MSIYYLYVKTHNKTGLKYLGKTTNQDPHKYRGSGTYWTNHLKKYGYDYTTVILKECKSNDEIKHWGLYFSTLWDIVNATDETGKKIWANLTPETGYGVNSDTARKNALKRIDENTHNFQGKNNPSYRRIKEGCHNFQGGNGSNQQRLADGCHNLQGQNNPVHALYAQNAHWIQSDEGREFVSKQQQEKLAKGLHPLQGDNNPNRIKVQCPHCNKIGGKTSMNRWHFDNCKFKN